MGRFTSPGDRDLQVQQKVHDHGYSPLQAVLHGNYGDIQITRLYCQQGILEITEVDKLCISHALRPEKSRFFRVRPLRPQNPNPAAQAFPFSFTSSSFISSPARSTLILRSAAMRAAMISMRSHFAPACTATFLDAYDGRNGVEGYRSILVK